MLALTLIRSNPDLVRDSLKKRHDDPALVDQILELDTRRRALVDERDTLRAEQNRASKEIGKAGRPSEEALAGLREMRERIRLLDEDATAAEAKLNELMLAVPNLVDPSVPYGEDESDNEVLRTVGTPKTFDFTPLPHWELGEKLGIIDFERGVKLSGSRFYHLRGGAARLQRALISWFLDVHTREHGFLEVYAPALVKEQVMIGSGQLPKFHDNLYHDAEEDLWLIPTSEVVLVNIHADEILPPEALAIRYVAYSPCFRREKFSAGRDVRGIKRGHQFDKVEMVQIVESSTSNDELDRMLAQAASLLERLELPYRVLQLCSGDLGFAMTKTFDLEVWAPGCNEWLEVSSCSNAGDYQARRANLRWRREPTGRPEFPHTLNGSGLALPRVLIAVLETYQQADGAIRVPEVLKPWMGGLDVIGPVTGP
ncbi:MAG: serine--tRNA ligase [Chloroflexota bacterium]|nr:serine--tRNA ligase [Chloroflexota bacterium]